MTPDHFYARTLATARAHLARLQGRPRTPATYAGPPARPFSRRIRPCPRPRSGLWCPPWAGPRC
jgi:hypothetical protein